MSVAFDAVGPSSSGATGSGVTTLSWTHTPVGTPTAASCQLGYWSNVNAVSGVTYGGTAMAQAVSQAAGTGNVNETAQIWGLANPASGAQTVQITFAVGGKFTNAGSVTVTGSDTTTCFSNVSSANGASAASGASTCTSAVGELVIDMCICDDGTTGVTITPAGGQTQRWGTAHAGTTENNACSTAPGAATVTMTQNFSANRPWAHVAASFLAAQAAGAISPFNRASRLTYLRM